MGYKGKLPVDGVNVWHKQGLTARKMELAKNENFLKICDRVWKEWAGFIKSRRLTSKIDIGSGYRPEIGYLHVDIQNWPSVEILGKAEELPLLDSSVGEIHSSHLIEHFTAKQLDKVLAEWHRVLEDGGTMVVSCPDILKVCAKLVKGTVDYNLGVSWIYGGQRDDYDFHYWSYCFRTLKEKLEASGFVEVTQLPDVDDWLKVRAVCKKDSAGNGSAREISQNDLKVLFRGTHYHIFGGGENMTFGVIKMLSELYPSLEVDIDLTKIDPKKAFDIDLGKLKPKTSRLSDLFISISHFSLPSPEGKKNIAVVFYPQYDWSKEIKRYDKVVAISEFSAKAVREKWKISPVVIPPSVDVSKFRVGEKKKQIISVGRFFCQEGGNNKNQHILIKAFSQMPDDWKLILVGSVQNQAYYDTLKKMARGMKVEFIHDIPFEDLANLYAESELFWSATGYGVDRPSSQEHFGIVAVEALASGCKTMVFNGGGMREIAGVQVWDTPQELVKISLEKGHDPKFLADGVKRYSPMVVREQWRELISGLVEGR
jgi:glycosyltransferase involved in cell wall biosynthesis/predicted SAM-dependent methyltransferase